MEKHRRSQLETKLVDLWLQDSKSSFIYDLYKNKKESFQSLIESVYFSRGQELHERLQLKLAEETRLESKEEKSRHKDEKELMKALGELREHYWMSELKHLHMVNAIERVTMQAKRAELMAVIRQQLLVAEKNRLEKFLGPKNLSLSQVSDPKSAPEPKKDFAFVKPQEAVILERFERDIVELKKYNKTLKNGLLGRFMSLFNNVSKVV